MTIKCEKGDMSKRGVGTTKQIIHQAKPAKHYFHNTPNGLQLYIYIKLQCLSAKSESKERDLKLAPGLLCHKDMKNSRLRTYKVKS